MAGALEADEREPNRVAPGTRVAFRFAVSQREMAAFAELSGDHSKLHCDEGYARDHGFQGRVVYGALLLAQLSRLIGMELPMRDCVWNGVRLDFRRPLYLGEEALLSAEIVDVSEAVRSASLKLRITAGERLIASGAAEVTYGG
jgi:3-hydroxybutyryl-CoA dehydratase